ncbi:phosphatidylglycerol lysyltransferase domain-containing protein [Shimia sagamensis]|uniref:Phosphatidylglycerol lysyltransferase n=1 Tax=Shimia sagamensis TaxID=1566352 RepID=A0ABY1NJB0_9RHOB|nr:phosphatidylglycerol lysyltransferase domain-containing protein [Shimia sagamensis]SMP10279.1 phosphatidylglycerol lysyltransferase [Shimia sagamensis]
MRTAQTFLRRVWPFAFGALCLWLLSEQIDDIDYSALWASVFAASPWQWGLALFFTAISFLAVSRYDVIAQRHFQMHRSTSEAMTVGATAIGLGQTLGAGVVVGTFVRWRMMPDLSLKDAARITAFVTVTFLTAMAVTIALAAIFLPTPHVPASLPPVILAIAFLIVVVAFVFPVLPRQGSRLSLPTLPAMAALLTLCLIDTIFAALALYVLLPPDLSLTFAILLPVFLIALGAAIFSGTPGGVGPFELTLLAMLPNQPEASLLAGVLAFRAIYYAVPALMAGLVLLRHLARPRPARTPRQHRAYEAYDNEPFTTVSRAELGVIRQNGGALLSCDAGRYGAVRIGQTLVALFDPIEGDAHTMARPLKNAARAQNRIACKYKISARQAVKTRKVGWAVVHISDEAVLTPTKHKTSGSTYRQLRRKLRQAEKAEVQVTQPDTLMLPLGDMARVSSAWEARNGIPKGLTMGRFDDFYVGCQTVFLAYQGNQLVGFVSFHATGHEWCLDLMRVLPEAPDGTMHHLVQKAIEAAAAADVPRLSLAAAPALPEGKNVLERKIRGYHFKHAGGAGLRQFKACFAPRWEPLFMAAPGPAQLGLAALDLTRAVNLRSAPATPIACQQIAQSEAYLSSTS